MKYIILPASPISGHDAQVDYAKEAIIKQDTKGTNQVDIRALSKDYGGNTPLAKFIATRLSQEGETVPAIKSIARAIQRHSPEVKEGRKESNKPTKYTKYYQAAKDALKKPNQNPIKLTVTGKIKVSNDERDRTVTLEIPGELWEQVKDNPVGVFEGDIQGESLYMHPFYPSLSKMASIVFSQDDQLFYPGNVFVRCLAPSRMGVDMPREGYTWLQESKWYNRTTLVFEGTCRAYQPIKSLNSVELLIRDADTILLYAG